MIEVMDLRNPKHRVYYDDAIGPQKAVVCAYEQMEMHNYNTWDYPADPAKHPQFLQGKHTCACGDWTTISDPEALARIQAAKWRRQVEAQAVRDAIPASA